MLVLRECKVCNKTDDALLKPGIDNEKTLFLGRYFHCVKLPVDVLAPDHPFNALFPDKSSEHLFVCAPDGSGKIPLESDTSRVDLWSAMNQVLAQAYTKSPLDVYKQKRTTFDKLDLADIRIVELEGRKAELLEGVGVPKSKLQQVDQELAKAKKERDRLREEILQASELALKPKAKAPAPSEKSAANLR
jgi:hypothetical protein